MPNIFCYICDKYTTVPITNIVKIFKKCNYHAYFGINLVIKILKSCTEYLCQWTKGRRIIEVHTKKYWLAWEGLESSGTRNVI